MRIRKILAATAAAAAVCSGALVVQSSGIASAHHPVIDAQTKCNPDGTWNATWTATSDNPARGKVWKIDAPIQTDYKPEAQPFTIGTYTYDANQANASLSVTASWKNANDDGGKVTNQIRKGTANKPAGCTIPTEVSWTASNGDCLNPDGNLTVGDNPNTAYTGDPSGTYASGTSVAGSFTPNAGYRITNQASYDATFETYGAPCEKPGKPDYSLSAECGEYSATFSNLAQPEDGFTVGDASFDFAIDGVVETIVVAPGETTTRTGSFDEDSGDHTVAVDSDVRTVDTNCEDDKIVAPALVAAYDCETETVSYSVSPEQGEWTVSDDLDDSLDVRVLVTANDGYVFADGESSVELFEAVEANDDCEVAPVAPSYLNNEECGQLDTYTITATNGVIYFVNGEATDAGTYTLAEGVEVTITAAAADGYRLTGEALNAKLVGSTEDCALQPVVLDIETTEVCQELDEYTISNSDNVRYQIVLEGDIALTELTGELNEGSELVVTAFPADGYYFEGDTNDDGSITLTAVGGIVEDCPVPTPTDPGFVDPTCANRDAALINPDTADDNVTYTIEGDIAPGSTVTVTVAADRGYVLPDDAQTVFTHTFATIDAVEDCVLAENPEFTISATCGKAFVTASNDVTILDGFTANDAVFSIIVDGERRDDIVLPANAIQIEPLVFEFDEDSGIHTVEVRSQIGDAGGAIGKTVDVETDCDLNKAVSTSPTFIDPTCDDDRATIIVADSDNIRYEIDGDVAPGETVTVTAVADPGFRIEGGTVFTHTFAEIPTGCDKTPETPKPPKTQKPDTCSKIPNTTYDSTRGICVYSTNDLPKTGSAGIAGMGLAGSLLALAGLGLMALRSDRESRKLFAS